MTRATARDGAARRQLLHVPGELGCGMFDDAFPIRNEAMTARQRWTILIVSAGGALETFDFIIYGLFAEDIGRAFFAASADASALTLSFAIGHVSRPLGGIALGRLGDKYGRRGVFAASAMVAAVSTLAATLLVTITHWPFAPALVMLPCAALAFMASFAMKPARTGTRLP
jgi:MFS family permease